MQFQNPLKQSNLVLEIPNFDRSDLHKTDSIITKWSRQVQCKQSVRMTALFVLGVKNYSPAETFLIINSDPTE